MAITNYIEDGKSLYEVYVNGEDARGKRFQRRKKGIESKRKAELIEFELKRELAQLKEQAVPYRWEEWFEECMKRMRYQFLPSTVATYDSQVKKWVHPHWTGLDLNTIAKADVYDLIFNKGEEFQSQYTRRNVLKMVKRIFQMAAEEGILERNPCSGISVRVAEVDAKVLTNAEAQRLLTEAKAAHHRFYPVWLMALLTGMRSGELYALTWMDVDLEARTIRVSKAWNSKNGITPTKTRKNRVVPISDDLREFLRARKLAADPADQSVLPRLGEWERGEQAKVTREFCAGLGITEIKFHDLRATFITNLLARGESLARVMSIVGHSELKTTNVYLRKAGIDVRGATEKLGYKAPQAKEGRVLSLVDRSGGSNP